MNKRNCLYLLIVFFLTVNICACACNVDNNQGTDVSDLSSLLTVESGLLYGHDIVVWFQGYGLLYDLPEEVAEYDCSIRIGEICNISNAYADGKRLNIYYQQECDSGYPIFLQTIEKEYRIGFLRLLNHPNLYGIPYDFFSADDPQAELLPAEPQFEYIWSDDGAYFSEVKKDGSIFMHPAKFKESDVGFSEIEEARGEPIPITVTDETLTMICFFDSQRPDMLVSKERMLQLVRDGYFMDYPCWVQVSDGKLLAAMQLNDR